MKARAGPRAGNPVPRDKKQQFDALYNMMQRTSENGLEAYGRLTR
jgi:hypothetical protein